ncbi:MAG: M3 family metallopeptidase [Promethearchaeota archaeon]
MTEKEIDWDFSEIYKGHDDPKIAQDMEVLLKKAEEFETTIKGNIKAPQFTSQDLADLFRKIEDFNTDLGEIEVFCKNIYNALMTLPENKALLNKFEDFTTTITTKLAFLDLEIAKFLDKNKHIISDPVLENYKHYCENLMLDFPHQLSEVEEQLIVEKDQHGIKEWSRLQGIWLNTREYKVMVEGKEKILSYGEANSLFTHPDRDTRISANKAIYGLLGKHQEIFTTAIRNVCGDWMKTSKRRKFTNPLHSSLIVNDVIEDTILNLMNTIENNVDVYRRYLKIKAKLLKLPKLSCADIMAPLPETPHKKYTWDEAYSLVIEAFNKFDSKFEEYAKDMFTRNHIDASPRMGKRNGAYCSTWHKGKSAFVLQTFTGNIGEIYTLIHELGHAIHAYLAIREQTFLNVHPGYPGAECASTFGELLLTDLLLEKAETPQEKMAILAHILDDAGQAAFQVSARFWFETSLYDAIKNGKNLDGETVSEFWCAGRDKIYGESVEWFDEMIWEWTMKGHYYIPNFRYYNYPYVLAQLFVYALYRVYKTEGKEFNPKFIKLLSLGGSQSLEDLGKLVGFDITKPEFWELGIKQYEDFVNQLENLI